MKFYKITVNSENTEKEEGRPLRHSQRSDAHLLLEKANLYSEKLGDNGFFFLSNAAKTFIAFGMILRTPIDAEGFVERFVRKNIPAATGTNVEETTFSSFQQMINEAERFEYIMDSDDVYRDFGLNALTGRSSHWIHFNECVVPVKSKECIYSSADRFFTKDTFNPELDRIFAGTKGKHFYGHPVDYILEIDDPQTSHGVTKLLIQALYSMGRLENKRFSELFFDETNNTGRPTLSAFFEANTGGAVVICMDREHPEDDDVVYDNRQALEMLCEVACDYRREVLTIFRMPRVCAKIKRDIRENMVGCTFIEISEELANYDKAVAYLRTKASENRIRPDKKLFEPLEQNVGYLTPELNRIFDAWYNRKLKTGIFSQYKDFESVEKLVVEEKPRGTAYDELSEMVGLDSAKKVINQALDSYKALKLFKDKGIVDSEMSRHMIFTGNPGTAKTTVARLFARIMKENGVVEKGQIVEVGRGDLVGKYVGWTAPTIQKKFKEAIGGILFIDEAYSLVDDRDGMYGDEAINTIVQEMENHRSDVIVIFAGYPDKMEGFLKKNPGLRSRIAHHVHFDDYTPEDLCKIAVLIAKQKGVTLDEAAMTKISSIMERAVKEDDFGNGRYVRNIIEKAKMAQSSRLVHMDIDTVTKEDVKRICAEDIEIPEIGNRTVKHIGFVS